MELKKNTEFKTFRQNLKLTQTELAAKLSVSQGTITDIERGRIGVSKKVIAKIKETFNILYNENAGTNTEYFGNKNTEKMQGEYAGGDAGGGQDSRYSERFKAEMKGIVNSIDKQFSEIETRDKFTRQNFNELKDISKKKAKYNELFFKELAKENELLYDTYNSLNSILEFKFTLENLEDSDITGILLLFESHYSNHDFSTALPNYKEYKQIRETELAKLLPFAEIFKNLSNAIEIFRNEMHKHGKSINYEDDLMPNEEDLPSIDETQASKEL